MLEAILGAVSQFILNTISTLGYAGIFILMALESANIPIPSEIIMPFSGFLVSIGKFNFFYVVLSGALGNLIGSLLSYFLAYRYGGKIVSLFSKLLFVSKNDFKTAERWFEKIGLSSVFLARLAPVIRTFISFPAGIVKIDLLKFSILTLSGSFIWSLFLTYVGFFLGENWLVLEPYFRQFDYIIALAVFAVGCWWFWYHWKKRTKALLKRKIE